jgi:hypothetical protein
VAGSNPGAEFVISATDKTSVAFRSAQQNLDQTNQLAKQAGDAVGGIAAKFLVVTAAAAGLSYVAGEFTNIVKEVAALDDAAEMTGASVENLSGALRALRPAGIGLDALTDASTKLVRAMSSADEETSKQGEAFSKLGIDAKNSAGALKDPVLLLQELGVALNKYSDDANKTALIQAILGKSGAQYLPLLKELGEAGKLESNVSTEQAAAAERLEKGWKNLSRQGQELRTSIANSIIPVLGDLITQFNQARAAGLGFFASLNTLPGSRGVTKKDQYDLAFKELGDLEAARKKLENGGIVDLNERLFGSGKNRAQLFDEKIQKQRELLAVYRTQGGDALVRQLPGVSLKDKAFYDADIAKPSAPQVSKTKVAGAVDKKTDFQKDKEAFAEIIALQNAQLKSTVELTRAQELQAKFDADLATGKKKYTAEQKSETKATIELIAAKDRELALKKLEKTSAEAVYQQQVAALETQLKVNADNEKTLKETRDRIEEIGKEGAALLILKDTRLAAAEAALKEKAALLLGGDRRGKDGVDIEPALIKERELAAQQRSQGIVEVARQVELQNKQMSEQIAMYGATEEAVVKYKNAKLDEQIVILQTELARRQETEGMSESVKALLRYQEALKNSKDLNDRELAMKRLVDSQRAMNEVWERGLEALILGGGKAKDVFKQMAIEIAKIQLKKIFDGFKNGSGDGAGGFLQGLFGKIFGGNSGAEPAGFDLAGLGSFFADGGVMTKYGKMPLNTYAGGGVANSPQVAVFGEGRMNEAFVPLPDGKRIPVDVRGRSGGASVVINQSISVGEGVSLSQVQTAMTAAKQQALAEFSNQMRRGGPLRDQVRVA